MSDFIHLHCHTEYSILDSIIHLEELCSRARALGMSACAVTDHGNMFAAAAFQKTCSEFGIKPVFGCEVHICRDHLHRDEQNCNHLVLLARSKVGYQNLVKMVNAGYFEGYFYGPGVDWGVLQKHAEGITCLTACMRGEIPEAILHHDMDKARSLARRYSTLYPAHFYLELQHNGRTRETLLNDRLMELAESEHLPIVATNDCHYLDPGDFLALELQTCRAYKTTLYKSRFVCAHTNQLYYKSPEQMAREFSFAPEAIANTARIAEECNFEITFGRHFFPAGPLPSGTTAESALRHLSEEGLEQRFLERPDLKRETYLNRLRQEMDVILQMGFANYFLIVHEFVKWARDHGIAVGPGRGSAAGSLVAWALHITNLDPVLYHLLFEPVLKPEQMTLPDIDVDLGKRQRDEVIRHLQDTYGPECVAEIATFKRLKAKEAIIGAARALGMSFPYSSGIAKLIPAPTFARPNVPVREALKTNEAPTTRYLSEPQVTRIIDFAMKLEGTIIQVTTHANGVVVSDKPMAGYLPLFGNQRVGKTVTQFDGTMDKQMGLLKFDFLCQKPIKLIQDTLDNIRTEGERELNMNTLPFTDPKVYNLYATGETEGVFPVDSIEIRQYLRKLHPTCFEDVMAIIALYRPGPLESDMLAELIRRKNREVPEAFPHPSLEDCLKETCGIIVYQEQIIQIAQRVAGYSLGKAELLCSALKEKNLKIVAGQRPIFVAGADRNNIDEQTAHKIFSLLEKYATCSFKKSRAAAYAQISYYTAYLKANFPCEFMAALLTSKANRKKKLSACLALCREQGIPIKFTPSINDFQEKFTAHNGKIVYGLKGIEGVGDKAIFTITTGRPFASFSDFCNQVGFLSKTVKKKLVQWGAFDYTGVSRSEMLRGMDMPDMQEEARTREGAEKQKIELNWVNCRNPRTQKIF